MAARRENSHGRSQRGCKLIVVDGLIVDEARIRLAVFLGVFALLIIAQQLWPRRDVAGGWRRSVTNILLATINTVILRIVFPLLAFDLALRLEAKGVGLLNQLSPVAGVIAGVLLLDVAIYWQHRVMHVVPLLWRLHRVHHTDTGFDVTTGVRFHPLEILVSMVFKLGIIITLGIPAFAVLVFELALSTGALFTHSNVSLPGELDRRLRWLFVTPEMHRVHHSWYRDETDSNYGFHLSLWDRLFRSYRDQPRDGHREMTIGLPDFRDHNEEKLSALLTNPFRGTSRLSADDR